MESLGTIEPPAGAASGRTAWITLIGQHRALAPVDPREGINPFTKATYLYRAPLDSARVLVDGVEVGSITWAEDDSQLLLVWSDASAKAEVVAIASDVATHLGWKFLPENAA